MLALGREVWRFMRTNSVHLPNTVWSVSESCLSDDKHFEIELWKCHIHSIFRRLACSTEVMRPDRSYRTNKYHHWGDKRIFIDGYIIACLIYLPASCVLVLRSSILESLNSNHGCNHAQNEFLGHKKGKENECSLPANWVSDLLSLSTESVN